MFVTHLYKCKYAASTILTHLSALSFVHTLYSMPDPVRAFIVQKVIAGVQKFKPQFDFRLPISLLVLHRITTALGNCSLTAFQRTMYKSMFLLAFAAFLRVGEMCVSNANTDNVLRLSGVHELRETDGLRLLFSRFKHSQGRQACIDIARQNSEFCQS